MTTLDELKGAFGAGPAAERPSMSASPGPVTDRYGRRIRSLTTAENGKWKAALNGQHGYPSDSEAVMGLIYAMVARRFTDGEIWQTLEDSLLFQARRARKGDKHARGLVQTEIGKARKEVAPFDDDPGEAPIPVHSPFGARNVPIEVVDPRIFESNGHRPAKEADRPMEDDFRSEPRSARGFIDRYVAHATKRTDAPTSAHELTAVGVLSTLAGPRVRLPIATSIQGWRLVVWTMYITNSTQGRKSTVLDLGRDVIVGVLGEEAVLNWEGSPQGILQRLAERDGLATVFFRDEYSGLMAQMNRAGHLAGLPQLFIRAYDGRPIENIRTRKKNKDGEKVEDTDRAEDPYLTKITATTWDAFVERATLDNVLDGFLARFTYVTGSADPRPVTRLTPELQVEQQSIVELAHGFYDKARRLDLVQVDDDVFDLAWKLEQAWAEEAADSSRPEAAGPALKRLAETVLRVAALIAVDLTPRQFQPVVTACVFQTARRMAEQWKLDALKVIDALGASSFMRDLESVLATINAHPAGIPKSNLLRVHRRIRARDLSEILTTLAERQDIEAVVIESGHGVKPVVFYPYGHAPSGVGQ